MTIQLPKPDFQRKLKELLAAVNLIHAESRTDADSGDLPCACQPNANLFADSRTVNSEKQTVLETDCCNNCIQDILSRAHTGEAHRHVSNENALARAWLEHRYSMPDLFGDPPQLASGFAQNIDGFTEAQLERIEQYWLEHQLCSPAKQGEKPKNCCAPTGSWQLAQQKALIEWEKKRSAADVVD